MCDGIIKLLAILKTAISENFNLLREIYGEDGTVTFKRVAE